MARDNAHTILLKKTLLALGQHHDLCRVWQNDTGVAKSFDGQRVIKYGLKGSSDILGIINGGKLLCLEIKTGSAVQSKFQKTFQRNIESLGGLYKVVRSEQDAVNFVKDNADGGRR